MKEIDRIEQTEARLNERIESIAKRFLRTKGATDLIDDAEQRNFQITPGQFDFYDDNWTETVDFAKKQQYTEALEAFATNYKKLASEKVDLSELPEKSDRQYVDSLIDEVNTSVNGQLKQIVETKYSTLREQLLQAHMNVDSIRQQFHQTVDFLRKDLYRIRRSLIHEDEKPQEVVSARPDANEHKMHQIELRHSNIIHTFPLMDPPSPTVKKHTPVRTKYKPKVMPFEPNLDNVEVTNFPNFNNTV